MGDTLGLAASPVCVLPNTVHVLSRTPGEGKIDCTVFRNRQHMQTGPSSASCQRAPHNHISGSLPANHILVTKY